MIRFCRALLISWRRAATSLLAFGISSVHAEIVTLDNRTHHLGAAGKSEWDLFEGKTPDGEKLQLNFEAHANERAFTLFIHQDDVKEEWSVTLNGKKLGNLFLMEADLIHTLPVPPNTLREGSNELVIATKTIEDILIHRIALGDDTKEKLLNIGPVTLAVREKANGDLIPSRLTIVDQDEGNALSPIYDYASTNLATRPGVIYTATGTAHFRLLPHKYTIYATRGPEYTMAKVENFDPLRTNQLDLTIERAADTRRWVASDTHIHTFELSKHGDATLRERIITLAAEGIELSVSTEHNLHADYAPTIKQLALDKYMTLLPGNELTTAKGHFNIFPVEPDGTPPNAKLESWPELFQQIRSTPKVQVAILNHATDTHSGFTPFASTNLNPITGRNLRGDFEFSFDAMELINSGAMRSDWMEPIRAWFALLNRGYKVVGVGASDSHDVSRFIVGQGRTYIRTDDSDVSRIDIDQACESLKAGHALVSLGVIAQLTIQNADGKTAGPGDLLSLSGGGLQCNISADFPLAPLHSATVRLFENGFESSRPVALTQAASADDWHQARTVNLPKPAHDTFYVTIVTVNSNPEPAWGLARPYQPTSPHFELQMIGVTNPVWVDADGDGRFTSAREYALRITEKYRSLPDLFTQIAGYDYYLAAHCAELLTQRGEDIRSKKITDLLTSAAPETKRAFQEYAATLSR